MSIRTLFDPSKDIDRLIEKVITFNSQDEAKLRGEVVEYVATDNIQVSFERLLNELDRGMGGTATEVGVWVSGFYGSGKSSFAKYVGFALDQQVQIGGQPFAHALSNQFTQPPLKALLRSVAQRHDPAVFMIDLAAQMVAGNSSMDISSVLYNRVMRWAGYSSDRKIAHLELMLERDGKLGDFKKDVATRTGGTAWKQIKDQPLVANQVASEQAANFYPHVFTSPTAFSNLRVDEVVPEDEQVRDMLALIRRRSGKENVVFILDEVGQYVAASDPLILNLDGLAKNIKNIGQGKVWILATAQQTLTEDDAKAHFNSPKLFKLKDRFPVGIDMEGRDIREITYKRLLGKSSQGEKKLSDLFDAEGAKLRLHTKLDKTRYYRSELEKEEFVRLYPFLPQHFDILLELLARLSRSTGGTGLRSAIRVIQDVLVGSAGASKGLADQQVGRLATAVTFYDTLRKDIQTANPHIVSGVDRIEHAFGGGSSELLVAKAIAVLQLLEDFPVSRDNVAALMYPEVGAAGMKRLVEDAVKSLMAEPTVTISEVDGSLRFMSEAVAELDVQRRRLIPTKGDQLRLLNGSLRDLFTPLPQTSLGGTRRVRAGLKSKGPAGFVSIEGSNEEVQVLIERVDEGLYEARRQELLAESTYPVNERSLFLLAPKSDEVERLLEDQWRSQRIYEDNKSKPASREVQEYLKGEQQRATRTGAQAQRALADSLSKGVVIFRGKASPLEQSPSAGVQAVLSQAASDIYHKYAEAAVQADSGLAGRFLGATNLDRISPKDDPLGLVKTNGQIDSGVACLQSVLSYVEAKEHVEGKALLAYFTQAPFAWTKDTVRYLVAALLTDGQVQLRLGGETIKVRGRTAQEALKSNQSFGRVGVSLRDSRPSADKLRRAAERLLTLTGDKVLPLEDDVSKAVTKHFPDLQQTYAALEIKLETLGLPDADRAKSMQSGIIELLKGDASDAATRLGPEECSLYDDLRWARKVKEALDGGIDGVVRRANEYVEAFRTLPEGGALGHLKQGAEPELEKISECLTKDAFYDHRPAMQASLTTLDGLIEHAATQLEKEQTASLEAASEELRSIPGWSLLAEEDRQQLSDMIDNLHVAVQATLTGVQGHPARQYGLDLKVQAALEEAKRRVKVLTEGDGGEGKQALAVVRLEDVSRTLRSPEEIDRLIERLEALKARFEDADAIQIDW